MDESEFETSLGELHRRQKHRELDAEFGRSLYPAEEIDRYEAMEVMGEAYERLSDGIHENVQAWSNGHGKLLQKVVTPTVYINGEVANTKTEFLLSSYNYSGDEKQPGYVEDYTKARKAVYEDLVQDAMEKNDFDSLLSVIFTYKESTMAKWLMNELHARKLPYPHGIAGNPDTVLGMINRNNSRIKNLKKSSEIYALSTARGEFFNQARKELNSPETGILRSLMLGIELKFGQPRSKSKWSGILLEEPLSRIMRLPTVPEQLVEIEKKGLPLAD